MTASTDKARIRRITVALDASPLSRRALEAALELAERLDATVDAVCVEDINLTRLASHPHALIYCMSTARNLPPDDGIVSRSIALRIEEARQALEETASARGMTVGFDLRHGKVAEEVIAAAEEADLLIVGWAARSERPRRIERGRHLGSVASKVVAGARGSVYLLQAFGKSPSELVVLFDGSPASVRAMELAAAMAPAGHLMALLAADSDVALSALKAKALEIAGEAGKTVGFEMLHRISPARLRAVATRHPGALLVLPGETDLVENDELAAMLDLLPVSVLVVR